MKQKGAHTYRNLFVTGLLFIVSFLGHFQLYAQQAVSIKNFNTTNGLPQNISGMVFDNNGYLWLSTTYGLIRYDGFNFKTYLPDTTNNKTNVSNQVLGIFSIGPEKKVIIRTKNGLLHTIQNGRPVLYDNAINNTTFTYVLRGHFPNLKTLNRFNLSYNDLIHKHEWDANAKEILPVNATDFIVLSNNSQILFYYKDGVKQSSININNKFSFFLKAGKYNLMADIDYNLYLYDSIANNFKQINNPFFNAKDKNEHTEKPAYYWDTYNDESYFYYNSIFYRIEVNTVTNTLKFIPCFSIEEQNHLWTGIIYDPLNAIYYLRSATDGLFQVKLKQVQVFNLADQLPLKNDFQNIKAVNYSLLKTSDSTVFTTSGVQFTSGRQGIIVSPKKELYSNRETMNMLGGDSIICAEGVRLFYYLRSNNYSQKYSYNDSFNKNNNAYITLLQPEGDSLWVGTRLTISCVTKKSVTVLFKRNRDNKSVFFGPCLFYRVTKDIAFFSNNFGLYKLKTSAPYIIDTFAEMKSKQVRHIAAYKDILLLSVYKHGLYVYRNNSFFKVPISDDRPEISFCHSTYIDKMGDVWITTDKGLFRTSISSIVESIANHGSPPFFFKYGETDGIENTEFNGGGNPPYALLSDGQLFYPSMGGIVTFNPRNLSDTLPHLPILIEKIETDNKFSPFTSDSIYLNADFNYLNIHLSVPHFGDPENLLLEYSIDSSTWKKINVLPSQNIILYNLSSGYHQLSIRKRVGLENTDYVYKTLTIFRKKNIYEQAWFFPLLAIAIVLLASLIIEILTRNVVKKRIALQKLVAVKTAELLKTAEAKELLINIISHDMVTPIRHIGLIAGFLEKGFEKDTGKIAAALLDIESTSDKILTGSLAIIDYMKYGGGKVVVNKKMINLYSFVEEVCEIFLPIAKKKNIGLFNKVSKAEFVEVDLTIFGIILNNIFSNAIKYAGKGNVEIFIEPETERKRFFKIKDTGIGIHQETLHIIQEVLKGDLQIIKTTNKGSTGLGYILISELAKIHGLTISVESEVNEGTTVTITI